MRLPLTEAIRLGAMLKQQAFHRLRWANKYDSGSCAIGAAFDAVGVKKAPVPEKYGTVFPELDIPMTNFVCLLGDPLLGSDFPCRPHFDDLSDYIMHLNDIHELSRGQIADIIQPIIDAKYQSKTEQEERTTHDTTPIELPVFDPTHSRNQTASFREGHPVQPGSVL